MDPANYFTNWSGGQQRARHMEQYNASPSSGASQAPHLIGSRLNKTSLKTNPTPSQFEAVVTEMGCPRTNVMIAFVQPAIH